MRKNRLIALIGTLTMAAAGLAAVSAGVSSKKAEGVSAATGTDVYFKAQWSGASITEAKVHYWNGGDFWQSMSEVYTDNGVKVYKYTIPSGNTQFQFQTYTSNWGSGEWHTSVNLNVEANGLWTPAEQWDGSNFKVNKGTAYPYTIQYSGNGNTSGTMSSSTAYGNVQWGIAKNNFEKTGYIFSGWIDGNGNSYSDQGLLPAKTNTNTVNLTAQWKKEGGSIAGSFNGWSTSANSMNKIDGNHFDGTLEFDSTREDSYTFKIVIDETTFYGNNINFNAALTSQQTLSSDGSASDCTLTLDSTNDKNRKIKAYFDFYKEYSGSPKLQVTQTFEKKVSFDDESASLYGYAGETVTLPSPVSVTGHTFNGWYNGSTLVGQAGASYTVPSNDIELSASWTADTYTVNYDRGANGSGTNQSDTKTYGEALTLKGAIFERDGFTQTGWSTTDGGSKTYDLGGTYTNNSGTTLYPYWTEDAKPKHTVTWIDGNGETLKTEQVEEGTTPSYTGSTPTKTSSAQYDYTFNETWDPTPAAIYGNATYTAQFNSSLRSYTITWLDDDDSLIDTTTVAFGTTPTHADPEKESSVSADYSFTGWDPTPTAVTGAATYKATYSSTPRNYTISWNPDGGTIDELTPYTNGSTPYGTPITAPTISKNGYELAGWNPALPATVGGEQEYTAQWRVPAGQYIIGDFNGWAANATGYSMSAIAGGGTYDREVNHVSVGAGETDIKMIWVSSSNNYTPEYKNALSVTHYNSPSGRSMAGTSSDGAAGTIDSDNNAVLPMAGVYTIKTYKDGDEAKDYGRHYALILEEYKLEFDMGGHGTNPGTEYALYNEAFTAPTAPAKDGNYTFAGWYTDTNYDTEFDFTTAYNENKVAYAKWDYDSVPVTISFNTNGGTTISPINGNSGESYSKPANPTKTNHTFAGWTWSGQTTPTNLPDVLPDADTEYTANWTLESGTYLAIMPNDSSSMPRDGQLKFDVHQGTQLVVKGLELHEGDQIRPYFGYGESDWNDITSWTWSHPDYAVSKTGNNILISEDGTYDIYFTYDTGAIHVSVPTMPENGRYLAINGDTSKDALKLMTEHSGYTGTEYIYSGNFQKGDKIRPYFQDSTQATIYDATLRESVKAWDYVEGEGLICPENGYYSIYLINSAAEGQPTKYDEISIFQEGEAAAVNFAKDFDIKMHDVCKAPEGSESWKYPWDEKIADAWDDLKEEFMAMTDTNAKALLKGVGPDSSNKYLAYFASFYDYVYSKYDGSEHADDIPDFIGRFDGGAGQNLYGDANHKLISVSDVSTSTWIIAAVAVVGIAAVGVFFIYRKRKEI